MGAPNAVLGDWAGESSRCEDPAPTVRANAAIGNDWHCGERTHRLIRMDTNSIPVLRLTPGAPAAWTDNRYYVVIPRELDQAGLRYFWLRLGVGWVEVHPGWLAAHPGLTAADARGMLEVADGGDWWRPIHHYAGVYISGEVAEARG